MDFKHISSEYYPAYTWLWNTTATKELIDAQIDEMFDAGIRAFYVLGEPENFRPTIRRTHLKPDYLSDEYGYCVESFKIEDLDSGSWHGDDAWVLFDDGSEMVILVGGHTLEEAIEAKEATDNDWESEFDDFIHWTDSEEWLEQQEFSDEWDEEEEDEEDIY